ncbi:hypothetical protein NC652_013913 [Populus alba x Populus x berolinensis]|nr:hypothetical protein NC652_013913 [Populus alba x Populus x berolinensis]
MLLVFFATSMKNILLKPRMGYHILIEFY